MGKIGRIACITTPMALTIASLVTLIMIFAAGTSKSALSNYYFFKADTSQFTGNVTSVVSGTDIDDKLLAMFTQQAEDQNLADFYKVYMWNYCSGTKTNGVEKVTFCSERKSEFWFNPIEVWGLNDTSVADAIPDKLQDGIKIYHKVVKWMFIAYAVTFFVTLAEILVGLTGICSRIGSCATAIVSAVQTLFFIASATTSTILYSTLAGTFDSVLKPYKIKASLSTDMLSLIWIGVAFSVGSGLFWLFSMCCCSGKSDSKRGRSKMTVEKTPYTYERVNSPYLGARGHGQDVQMGGVARQGGAPWEPYRHDSRV